MSAPFDFEVYFGRQVTWSARAFGTAPRLLGLIAHIRKECDELESDPSDIEEVCDVIILALELAWRSGHTFDQLAAALEAKQAKNRARSWPPLGTVPEHLPIEHLGG